MVALGGHESRERERWVMWELPLARGFQYLHALLRRNDVECQWSDRKAGKALVGAFDMMREAWRAESESRSERT